MRALPENTNKQAEICPECGQHHPTGLRYRLNVAWKTRGCVKGDSKEEGKCGLDRFGNGKQGRRRRHYRARKPVWHARII